MEQLWGVARLLSDFRNRPAQGAPDAGDTQQREQAQQTANLLTTLLTARQTQQPRDEEEEESDEPTDRSSRHLLHQDQFVVFSSYTHIAIVVGLVANILLGGLRMLW